MTRIGPPGYAPLTFEGAKKQEHVRRHFAIHHDDIAQERPMAESVPQALKELGNIYEERNKIYGSNYLNFGKAAAAMFPKGLRLQSADDFNRFALFIHIATKLTRYAEMFERGGHSDSLDDLAVYAQMLLEVDAMISEDDLKRTMDPRI